MSSVFAFVRRTYRCRSSRFFDVQLIDSKSHYFTRTVVCFRRDLTRSRADIAVGQDYLDTFADFVPASAILLLIQSSPDMSGEWMHTRRVGRDSVAIAKGRQKYKAEKQREETAKREAKQQKREEDTRRERIRQDQMETKRRRELIKYEVEQLKKEQDGSSKVAETDMKSTKKKLAPSLMSIDTDNTDHSDSTSDLQRARTEISGLRSQIDERDQHHRDTLSSLQCELQVARNRIIELESFLAEYRSIATKQSNKFSQILAEFEAELTIHN